jgi:nicotinamidase/pyrazinamidase
MIINTADWHNSSTTEISKEPDFINTFPAHCIENTEGAEFIEETRPHDFWQIKWDDTSCGKYNGKHREIIIYKDKFDVFEGNKFTEKIIKSIKPEIFFVYGVAMNVCVDAAVKGLLNRGYKVYVVLDAIKELPDLPVEDIIKNWTTLGCRYTTAEWIIKDYAKKICDIVSIDNDIPYIRTLIKICGNEKYLPDNK